MGTHSLAITALSRIEATRRDAQRRQQEHKNRLYTGPSFRERLEASDAIIREHQESELELRRTYGPEAIKIANAILQQRRF
jgi:hypothetical protein